MKAFLPYLNLKFLPVSKDFGLLLLRAGLGLGMLAPHGWEKFQTLLGLGAFSGPKHQAAKAKLASNVDVFHLGGTWSVWALVFAEVVCSALLIIGFATRFAALVLAIAMGVAFFVTHQHALTGEKSGEKAALYLTGFVVPLFAGPGRYSFDSTGGGK